MSSYRFTPQAIDDLFEIWSYIATDDVDAALVVQIAPSQEVSASHR